MTNMIIPAILLLIGFVVGWRWLSFKPVNAAVAFSEAQMIHENHLRYYQCAAFEKVTNEENTRAARDFWLNRAARLYRKAIRLSEVEREPLNTVIASAQLGMLLHLQGNVTEAEVLLQNSLSMIADFPEDQNVLATLSNCHYHLGFIAARVHRNANLARKHFQTSIEIEQRRGDVQTEELARSALAWLG